MWKIWVGNLKPTVSIGLGGGHSQGVTFMTLASLEIRHHLARYSTWSVLSHQFRVGDRGSPQSRQYWYKSLMSITSSLGPKLVPSRSSQTRAILTCIRVVSPSRQFRIHPGLGQCRVIDNKLKYHQGKTRMRQTALAICVWKRTKPSRSGTCCVL